MKLDISMWLGIHRSKFGVIRHAQIDSKQQLNLKN